MRKPAQISKSKRHAHQPLHRMGKGRCRKTKEIMDITYVNATNDDEG